MRHAMHSYLRQTVALTAIAGVLIGNSLGLLHVGHHLQANLGSARTIGVDSATAGSEVAGSESSRRFLACSCQSHCGETDDAGNPSNGPAPASEDSASKDPARKDSGHDSGKCSICQSYLATRAAILPPVVGFEVAESVREPAICVVELLITSGPTLGHSVRGPPPVC